MNSTGFPFSRSANGLMLDLFALAVCLNSWGGEECRPRNYKVTISISASKDFWWYEDMTTAQSATLTIGGKTWKFEVPSNNPLGGGGEINQVKEITLESGRSYSATLECTDHCHAGVSILYEWEGCGPFVAFSAMPH